MKAKELLYYIGFKPKPKIYGVEEVILHLPKDGPVKFAQWLHPRNPSAQDHFSQATVDMLRQFIKPGDFAIDIGAHTGDSTMPIALATGPTGAVFALEPNPYVFPILEKNAATNPEKTRIIPLPFAATPLDREIVFEYSDAGFCNGGSHEGISSWRLGHAFKLKVRGRNLHHYLGAHHSDALGRIRFIKVDAEGYDHTILTTLTDMIKRSHPYIKAEIFKYTTQDQRHAFLKFLQSHHYRVYRTVSDNNYYGPPLTVNNLVEKRHYDIFCVPEESAL